MGREQSKDRDSRKGASRDISPEDRAFMKSQDERDNTNTTPGPDERIWIPAIWVVEAFTPPLIAGLEEGAKRLGWGAEGPSLNEDFLSQIGDYRASAGYSGWINLGYIHPSSDSRRWPFERRAPLPGGIKSLSAKLIQPFPSTTLLCCMFALEPELSESIQEPLRAKYTTEREEIGDKQYRYWNVEHLKERAVRTTRAYVRSVCTGWVKEYFSGFFASPLGGGELPTYELLLFAQYEAFSASNMREQPEWLRLIGFQVSPLNWRCESLPNLFLASAERREPSKVTTLFGNAEKVLDGKDIASYGSTKSDQVIHWMTYFDRSFATLTLGHMADSLMAQVARLRDELGQYDLAAESQMLWQWEKRLSELQRTALPFVADLKAYCKYEKFFLHDLFEFQQETTFKDTTFKLFRDLRTRLRSVAKGIQQGERQLRAIATQTGRIISSISNEKVAATNIRLQRGMFVLTIVMLALTIVTALEPFAKLLDAIPAIRQRLGL